MYELLKRLYQEGRATKNGLVNAVAKGWLTDEQYEEITGEVSE